jgi:hypothetical protein
MEKEKQLYLEPEADDYPLRSRLEPSAQVVGTTNLYENGELNYIPMPTPDPKGELHRTSIPDSIFQLLTIKLDPLNLPKWRKVAALVSICFCMYRGLLNLDDDRLTFELSSRRTRTVGRDHHRRANSSLRP